jgi:exoribonuclease R
LGAALAFLFAVNLQRARSLERGRLEHGEQKEVERVKELHGVHLKTLQDNHDLVLKKLQEDHRKELKKLLGYDLNNLLVVIGEVLTEHDPTQRQILASNARNRAVWCAAMFVGKTANNGTRANLFRLNAEKTEMRPVVGGFAGRGDKSTRVLTATAADDTFNKVMANESVFVESVPEDEVTKQGRTRYRTYIAHPVSIGPDRIYGALTVDCPNVGDLDEDVDTAKVAVFAGLIAATYEF